MNEITVRACWAQNLRIHRSTASDSPSGWVPVLKKAGKFFQSSAAWHENGAFADGCERLERPILLLDPVLR
jgi:hypothetical protein